MHRTLTFKKLPELNEEFGNKTINLKYGDRILASIDYQVFYTLRAGNNPIATRVRGNIKRSVNNVLYYSQALDLLDDKNNPKDERYVINHYWADGESSSFSSDGLVGDALLNDRFCYRVGISKYSIDHNGQKINFFDRGPKILSYISLFKYALRDEKFHVDSMENWWTSPSNFKAKKGQDDRDLDVSSNTNSGDYIPDLCEYEYDKDGNIVRSPVGYPNPGENIPAIAYDCNKRHTYGDPKLYEYNDFEHYVDSTIQIDDLSNSGVGDWGCPGMQYKKD